MTKIYVGLLSTPSTPQTDHDEWFQALINYLDITILIMEIVRARFLSLILSITESFL